MPVDVLSANLFWSGSLMPTGTDRKIAVMMTCTFCHWFWIDALSVNKNNSRDLFFEPHVARSLGNSMAKNIGGPGARERALAQVARRSSITFTYLLPTSNKDHSSPLSSQFVETSTLEVNNNEHHVYWRLQG